MFQFRHETIEAVFGPFIAEYFNEISCALLIGGFIISTFCRTTDNRKKKEYKRYEKEKKQWLKEQARAEKLNKREQKKLAKKSTNTCSPTGWTYNENTKMWDPPENLKTKKGTGYKTYNGNTWYPEGVVFNEAKQKVEKADYNNN